MTSARADRFPLRHRLRQVFLSMARTPPVLNTISWITRARPRVLLYHRFAPRSSWRALGIDVFDEHMRLVRRRFVAMTVSDLWDAVRSGRAPANAVAITIDDGHEDAYTHALPVLRAHGLPATFYVTTGFVDGATWLWPDRVSYAVSHCPLRRARVPLRSGSLALGFGTDAERREAWFALTRHIETLPAKEAQGFLEALPRALDVHVPRLPTREYRAVTWSQLREFAAAGIEIGDHTWSHPLLPRCTPDELHVELHRSKIVLERHLGARARSFAYPHGEWNAQVREAVREAGYDNAVISTNWRSLDWTDGLAIPRLSHGGAMPRFQTTISGAYNLAAQFGYRVAR